VSKSFYGRSNNEVQRDNASLVNFIAKNKKINCVSTNTHTKVVVVGSSSAWNPTSERIQN
jgi:hypothetical protein